MSNIDDEILPWLQESWRMEIVSALVNSGLKEIQLAQLLSIAMKHRESMSAVVSGMKHGWEFYTKEAKDKAAQYPFLTRQEREKSAVADTRWHNRTGFVYLMRNQRNGLVKIGFSKDPKFREGTLQSEEPEIELMFTREATAKDELELHERFKGSRVRGEWFSLSEEDIAAIKTA